VPCRAQIPAAALQVNNSGWRRIHPLNSVANRPAGLVESALPDYEPLRQPSGWRGDGSLK